MKRICSLLLVALLLSLCLSAAAYDYGNPVVGAVVSDGADLLSNGEESTLNTRMASLCQQYGINIAIVTTDSLGGKDADNYADDRFDGLFGDDADGIIFLIAMQEREWRVVAYGTVADRMSSREAEASGEAVASYLSHKAYYNGFVAWLEVLPDHLEVGAAQAQPNFVIALVIGAAVALIVVLIMRRGMNTKRQQASARHYLVPGTYHLRVAQDFYLYSHVTKRPRPKNNSSSGGGGGRSRSSGGGKF